VLARLNRRAGERPPAFWRGAAVLARAALILADHEVSSRPAPTEVKGCGLFANTKNGAFDQPLCWHLQTVSRRAADFAWRIAGLRLPGLATETVEHILSPADERGRFAWQNRAVAAVSSFRARSEAPLLIFNVAATGAGKTIANAKLACVASPRPRFAIALNLRTLTLQTGDALRESLGLGADEMATVIGDRVAARLHAAGREQGAYAGTFETDGPATEYDALGGAVLLPGWMKVLTDARPSLAPVIGAPVLVSTIDYLINAGEPGRQAHHVGALLRIADSDLVLDEVDAYAPEALVAVLRLIQTAGLMGRNVICSSATLPVPVAEAVSRAFGSGVAMRGALEGGEGKFGVVAVDDRGPASVFDGAEDFAQRFQVHLDALMKLPAKAVRRAFIQPVGSRSQEGFESAVVDAVHQLHGAHRWRADNGKTLSFGLVRVANISTAIATSRALALALPHARVACYHARDFRIHRHLKELRLDFLLNRKRGDRHILADAEIADLLGASPDGDVPFIVVATPVEEIGRDHDFDWGVIEPSSAHSIVQAAGRVNRHRLLPVSEPNIAILSFNARWATGREGDAVFLRPGLESRVIGMWRYASSDMNVLLEGADLERLDVRLRLGACLMATEEDRIVAGRLAEPMKTLIGADANPSGWMTQGFYDWYRLRDGAPQRTWRVVREEGAWVFRMDDVEQGGSVQLKLAEVVARAPNDWLCWELDELAEACLELEVDTKEGASRGLEFQCPDRGVDAPNWDQSFGFF
jgi:CRISPR-associated endonuclease/helicase Cas3